MLVVMVGWVFFRSDSLDKALAMLRSMAGWAEGDPVSTPLAYYLPQSVLAALILGSVAATPVGMLLRQPPAVLRDSLLPVGRILVGAGWRAAYSVFSLILLSLSAVSIASGTYNPFIYFRF
jgi:alginate O-acetyltransferase complex protein AlgI